MLRGTDFEPVLRPVGAGRDGAYAYVWLAAEAPADLSDEPWRPTFWALESLAAALAFLHASRYYHGRVGPEALFLNRDGRTLLAPWPREASSALEGFDAFAHRSRSLDYFALAASQEVLQACRLFPAKADEPQLAAVAEKYREWVETGAVGGQLRPPTGDQVHRALWQPSVRKRHGAEPSERTDWQSAVAEKWLWAAR